MKNSTKIIGIALIVLVCLVAVFVGTLTHQYNDEEETTKRKTNSHYSNGDNEIDKKIAEISNDKKRVLKSQIIDNVYDYVVESNGEDMPYFFMFNDIRYYQSTAYVEDEYVEEKLGVDEEYGVAVYKIKDITDEFSVAVLDETTGKYWSYSRYYEEPHYYMPGNLKEFFESSGFYRHVKNVRISLYDVYNEKSILEYYDNSDILINNLVNQLEKVSEVELGQSIDYPKKTGLKISFVLDHIEEAVTFIFYENGNIQVECNVILGYSFLTTKEDGLKLGCDMIDVFLEYLE